MRIFIGVSEIANFVATYAQGAEVLGHETFTVLGSRNRFYSEFPYDIVLAEQSAKWNGNGLLRKILRSAFSRLYALRAFGTALATCDVFVYNTGGSLLPGYMDYKLIKLLRKRLVVTFLGSEIRYWYAYEQEMKQLGQWDAVYPYVQYFKEHPYGTYFDKVARIRAAERYADLILSQPGYAQLQTRPYMRVWIGLDLTRYHFRISGRPVPLVVHAPSNRSVKGTEFVLAAIDKLRQEKIPFEFRLIENLPNSKVRELLAESDVLIDELHADTVGVLSTEGMATGNAVLTSYLGQYSRVPSDCPAINVNRYTLVDSLRWVLTDPQLRGDLARAGRVYVETYHDQAKIFQDILTWLQQPGGIKEPDFSPTFYQSFIMPPELVEDERVQARQEIWQRFRRYI